MWAPLIQLHVRSNGQWLNDSIVNTGQVLIKEMLPNTCGLQDVSCSMTLSFQPEVKRFVQVFGIVTGYVLLTLVVNPMLSKYVTV